MRFYVKFKVKIILFNRGKYNLNVNSIGYIQDNDWKKNSNNYLNYAHESDSFSKSNNHNSKPTSRNSMSPPYIEYQHRNNAYKDQMQFYF